MTVSNITPYINSLYRLARAAGSDEECNRILANIEVTHRAVLALSAGSRFSVREKVRLALAHIDDEERFELDVVRDLLVSAIEDWDAERAAILAS